MTPEGRVKKQVKKILGAFWGVYVEMPGLEFTCIVNGYALVIETKAPGKWLTGRQRETARQIFVAGGAVFFISNNDGLRALLKWMLAHALKKELE
jgi:hypothetical protein